MPQTPTQPTFLPLTTAAAGAVASRCEQPLRDAAAVLLTRAADTDRAAADCWTALLANCDTPGRQLLPARLRALTEAVASYAGGSWWRSDGSYLRRRLLEAQHQLVEAVREADGEDFAEAFAGYDQALATTVVAVQNRLASPA